jgi:hypothetical protein
MSEAALKSEHGVNNYLGSSLGLVQIRIHAFFISKEAASQEKGCAKKIYLLDRCKSFIPNEEGFYLHS